MIPLLNSLRPLVTLGFPKLIDAFKGIGREKFLINHEQLPITNEQIPIQNNLFEILRPSLLSKINEIRPKDLILQNPLFEPNITSWWRKNNRAPVNTPTSSLDEIQAQLQVEQRKPANPLSTAINILNRQRFAGLLYPSLIAELASDGGTINGLFQAAGYAAPECPDDMEPLAYFQEYPHTFPTFIALCRACELGDDEELSGLLEDYDKLKIELPGGDEISREKIKGRLRQLGLKTAELHIRILIAAVPELQNLASLEKFNKDHQDIFFDTLCDEIARDTGALWVVLKYIAASSKTSKTL